MKKILLMYISEHSGHHQASIALEKAILNQKSDAAILNINAFKYVNPLLEKVIHGVYMNVIKKRPAIWGYLYDNPKIVAKTQRIRSIINDSASKKIGGLIDRFNPGIVACTQAFPCGIFAGYKKKKNLKTPLVGILTDYAPHAYWVHKEVDAYIVPSPEVGMALAKKGVQEDRIKPLGIPIDSCFAVSIDKDKVRGKLNLLPGVPIVMVMGGTHGIGPDENLIKALAASQSNYQVILISGINKGFFKKACKIASGSKKKIVVLGFTDNVHEIMGIADIIITKPGGLTTAESLAKLLPMIIVNPLPGQEDFNTTMLVSRGMAVRASGASDAVRLLEDLLTDPDRCEAMRETIMANARPRSSENIANFLLNMAN